MLNDISKAKGKTVAQVVLLISLCISIFFTSFTEFFTKKKSQFHHLEGSRVHLHSNIDEDLKYRSETVQQPIISYDANISRDVPTCTFQYDRKKRTIRLNFKLY